MTDKALGIIFACFFGVLFFVAAIWMLSEMILFHAKHPQRLFSGDPIRAMLANGNTWNYDVSADGQRFVVIQAIEQNEESTPTITVVENWIREFDGQ